MPKVICLAGPAGTDKNKLLRGIVSELTARGFKIGLIAEDADGAWNPEPGPAEAAVRISPHGLKVWRAQSGSFNTEQIVQRFLPDMDMVLSEAYQDEARPKIEFVPPGAAPRLEGDSGLRALVSQEGLESDKPVFAPQDVKGLADFILEKIGLPGNPPRVRILIQGKPLPINGFVQKFVDKTIRGIMSSLRGGDKPGRMEIFLD